MFPGETILSGAPVRPGVSEFKVMRSGGGYYIGTTTANGSPYTRETGYFGTEAEANTALEMYEGGAPLARRR